MKRTELMKKVTGLFMAGALVCSMGMQAAASGITADGDVEMKGYIAADGEGSGIGPGDMINIEFAADGYYWAANESTAISGGGGYEIKSPSFSIENKHDRMEYTVTLKEYSETGTGGTIDNTNVKLALTGDLAHADTENLLNDFTEVRYSTSLQPGDKWEYGFGGVYSGTLGQTAKEAEYTMVLEFEVTGIQ